MMVRLSLGCVLLLAAGWFYSWAPASFPVEAFGRQPTEFYHELSDALIRGHARLERQPDPRLVALPDPYDPAQNAPYRVNNLSYFRGHYYLYMGVAPALLLFVPVKLLTGYYLSHEFAVVILCVTGLAAGLGIIWRLRAELNLLAGPATMAVLALALGLANGYNVVLPGALAQEVAIAGGFAFAMVALLACTLALSARRAWLWFGLASVALGAAIGSRPEYVFASVALLPPLFTWWSARGRGWTPAFWGTAAAAVLPLVGVVVALLAYNYARFGAIFEFGQHYMLGGWNQLKLGNSSGAIVRENAWRYLAAPGHYSRTFPFVTANGPLAIGAILNVPWLWLLPFAIWALAQKSAPSRLRAIGLSALGLALANLLVLLVLPSGNADVTAGSANARYVLDFLPGLTLFVSIGVLAAHPWAAGSRIRRFGLGTVVAMLVAASVLAGLSLNFERFPPEDYRPVSLLLNLPDFAVRAWGQPSFGPLDMDLAFPTEAIGRYEPLVTTGAANAANLLYVTYTGPNEIQLGFMGSGIKGPLSDRIPLGPHPVHRLLISFGSLYPPIGYPSLAGFDRAQVAFLKRDVHVVIDGHPIFDAPSYCYPAPPGSVRFGQNSILPGYTEGKFSGRILAVRRAPITPLPGSAESRRDFGALRLLLRFPAHKAGQCEPLVVTGVPEAGDFIYVRYLDDRHVSFGLDHWGGLGGESAPQALDLSRSHTVEVSMGSLYPPVRHSLLAQLPPARREQLKQQVRILVDGSAVFSADRGTYEASSSDVIIGRNAIGGSVCDYAFTGTIEKVERLDLPYAASGK